LHPHFLSEVHDFLFDFEQKHNIAAGIVNPVLYHVRDLHADLLDFDVGLDGEVIDVVSDGDLGALGNDVEDMFAFHEIRSLNAG
jgi:hypothetical protein